MTQSTKLMLIMLKDGFIRPKNVYSVYMKEDSKRRYMFFEHVEYRVHVEYEHADGSRSYHTSTYSSKKEAREDLESVIEQVKLQLADDHYLTKLFEDALKEAGV